MDNDQTDHNVSTKRRTTNCHMRKQWLHELVVQSESSAPTLELNQRTSKKAMGKGICSGNSLHLLFMLSEAPCKLDFWLLSCLFVLLTTIERRQWTVRRLLGQCLTSRLSSLSKISTKTEAHVNEVSLTCTAWKNIYNKLAAGIFIHVQCQWQEVTNLEQKISPQWIFSLDIWSQNGSE